MNNKQKIIEVIDQYKDIWMDEYGGISLKLFEEDFDEFADDILIALNIEDEKN